jgi:hypothetical protein
MDGVKMGYGDGWGGKIAALMDGYIDFLPPTGRLDNFAFFSAASVFTNAGLNNWPIQIFIDLGEKYELSRIVTHQMWDHPNPPAAKPSDRATFYGGHNNFNVKSYKMYYWDGNDDATVGEWRLINHITIPSPTSEMGVTDIIRKALAGNESLMYPDAPGYTPPTRYFRYEPITGFLGAYGGTDSFGLGELTLFGRKANR